MSELNDFLLVNGLYGTLVVRVSNIEQIKENSYLSCSEIVLYDGKVIQTKESVKSLFDKINENK